MSIMSLALTNNSYLPSCYTQQLEEQRVDIKDQDLSYINIKDEQNLIEKTQQIFVDISRAEPFLSLASIGYPPLFFMPKKEDVEDMSLGEIRRLAIEFNNGQKYAEAVKLCIKLLVNYDDINSNRYVYLIRNPVNEIAHNTIITTHPHPIHLTFNEIQAILFSCKNESSLNQCVNSNNKITVEHLNYKTNGLLEAIESNTRKAKLLLKSVKDGKSQLAIFPHDIILAIARIYLDVIADIGQTPVNIVSNFPT